MQFKIATKGQRFVQVWHSVCSQPLLIENIKLFVGPHLHKTHSGSFDSKEYFSLSGK